MAAAPEVNNNVVDLESKEYVADKGPIIQWELDVPNKCLGSFSTLRIFGLKLGFSTVTGVQGHYLLNTAGQMDASPETQVFTAPCLMHFVDTASVPVFVLMFKWVKASGKIYALTIPTDVKLSSDVDAPDKWITPAMIKPVKLALASHFEPIENRDGQPLAKKLDAWMKDHFPLFAALKLKSLANCRTWLQPSSFVKHVPAVAGVIESTLRADITAAAGLDASKKATSHTNSAEVLEAAKQLSLSECLPLLASIKETWLLAAATIAVPLGHRLIEIEMSSALVDEVLSPEKLATLFVQTMSPKHHESILALLQKSDTAKLLASGQKTVLDFTSSPFPEPPAIEIPSEAVEVVDGVETDADVGAPPHSHWSEADSWEEDAEELGHATTAGAEEELQSSGQAGARKRAAPVRLDSSVPIKKKDKKHSNLATPISGSTRQPYQKTGLFSKDPVKAAAARAALTSAGKELPSRATEPKFAKVETEKAGEMNTIQNPPV